jgi:DNA-binding response OmpR family regulator
MNPENKPLVLAVDDDSGILKLIQTLMKRNGIECLTAENATDAAEMLRNPPLPQVLILDMMLPDVNGLAFLREIRQKSMFDQMPVLILSALADPDQIREGLEIGADRYITKPYINNNLVPSVQELLKKGRQQK